MDATDSTSTAEQRECECGFVFSGPGEYRNHKAHQDINGHWWNECPTCGRIYRAD